MADYKLNILIDQLRYQIVTPRVTTMGHCANEGCSHTSRGGRECQWCVYAKMRELIGEGNVLAHRLFHSLTEYRDAWWASEEAIEALLNSKRS
jgi:hypothetical protein